MAEEPEEGAEPGSKPAQTSSPFRYFFLILLILLVEAAAGYLFLDRAIPPREDVVAEEAKKKEEEAVQQKEEAPLYYDGLKDLVVTPAPAQVGYLVQLSIALEVFPKAVIEELTTKHELMLDLALQTLETFPAKAFRDPYKKPIKEALKKAFNGELRNGEVRAVYFTDFVMQ